MKNLVLVRHAKSSWKHDLQDIDRPLNKRGKNDANLLSKHFKRYNFVPDKVVSSPANRAKTTCDIFIKNLNLDSNILEINKDLYDFGGQSVLHVIKNLDDSLDKVMIFGHNHAFTTIANSLGNQHIDNVPTTGLVMLKFDVEHWKNVKFGHTELTIFPKELKS